MKKGIMFSIILFFLAVSLVGLIAIQRSLVSYRRERIHVEMRIKSLNNMYDSLIRDAGSALDTSLNRAMNAAFKNVTDEGIGLQEANETLKELVWYGTIGGRDEDLMENATFPYWIDKIEQVDITRGFEIDINPYTLEIKPYDSFNLLAEVEMDVDIIDIQGVAALNRSVILKKIVSIEEMEDPLYPLKTSGLVNNKIISSPYVGNYTQLLLFGDGGNGYVYGTATNDTTDFSGKILIVDDANPIDLSGAVGVISETDFSVIPSIPFIVQGGATDTISDGQNILLDGNGANNRVWYIENLKEHVENLYYQSSETGASYLDRLEGRTYIHSKYSSQTNNDIGLESFIDKSEFPSEIPVYEDKSNVDYLYFSSGPLGNKVKGISTTSNWFRIDSGHQDDYGVEQITEPV